MNHRGIVPAVRNDQGDYEDLAPGEFQFTDREAFIYIGCPCGCGDTFGLPVRVRPPGWSWNEDRDRPSLAPSIRRTGGCRWHGFLTAGQFKPCGDSGQ